VLTIHQVSTTIVSHVKRLKIFTILAICLLLISAGCATPSPTPEAPTSPQTPAAEETPAAPTPTPAPTPTTPTDTGELKVHFIDVGQGDAILIDFRETEILIDGGDRSPGVEQYLNDYVDEPLEVLVATHPHADHIGGLIAVLANFDVGSIWLNGDTSTSQTYNDFMSAVNAEGAEVHVAKQGDQIQAGDLVLDVLNPTQPLTGSTNNNSIVTLLSYGDTDSLFTGDAEAEAEASMINAHLIPDVEILKVGHHGSRTASSRQFIEAAEPEVAIYMAGEGNTYGHPHEETIILLDEFDAEIYGTDVHGTIVVTIDGEAYTLQLEKQAPPCSPPAVSPALAPEPAASGASDVQITRIFYDGVVSRVESDEYVEITNLGTESQDLAGWVLKDISEGYPSLVFPSYVLESGDSIRVYTNEYHPEWGGFSFGSGKAVWNNTEPDTAVLYNAQGQEISRKSY